MYPLPVPIPHSFSETTEEAFHRGYDDAEAGRWDFAWLDRRRLQTVISAYVDGHAASGRRKISGAQPVLPPDASQPPPSGRG